MAISAAKAPVDLQEIVFKNAVKRGVDVAMTKIISILGCTKTPFTKVRVGRTDQELRAAGQPLRGYTVYNVFSSPNPRIVSEVDAALATWLRACHGQRCENGQGGEEPVKQGNSGVYLAVK